MPTINFANITTAYKGSTALSAIYHGDKKIFPKETSVFIQWRFDYTGSLSEIQASFDGSNIPLVLDSGNGVSSFLRSAFDQGLYENTGALNDAILNGTNQQRIGWDSSYPTNITSFVAVFNSPKQITSVWLAPQGYLDTNIYNSCSNFKLYKSNNGTSWTLAKEWVISSGVSSHTAPFANTSLRPNQLVQFIV